MTRASDFLSGYIECAIWCGVDDDGFPLDREKSSDDFAPEARARMARECAAFMLANADDLQTASETRPWDHLGHDLWLTRNGHGTGFWDRNELAEDLRDRLADAARKLGEQDFYITDDGQIDIL